MAIHHLTPPFRGGERPRLPSAQAGGVLRVCRQTFQKMETFGVGGPVTQAIRAMRAAQPKAKSEIISHLPADISELRRRIAERIEADIALLDALAGDPDQEDGGDDEPSLGSLHGTATSEIQFQWSGGASDDREEENEHGCDINDEPHDPEEDAGAEQDEHHRPAYLCHFNGYNYAPVGRDA